METTLAVWLNELDRLAAFLVPPLAVWILLNGLDDLIPIFLWLGSLRRGEDSIEAVLPEKRIAIFVPLWHEHRVIGRMLEQNIAAIRYGAYEFFVGVYPNDQPTVDMVKLIGERHSFVHLALCPHDGPTSKPDCLNWIYQNMLLFEEKHDLRFEIIATHDAEDVIHPESLSQLNRYAGGFDMVQVPVIPIPTPIWQLTHGLYCDDFAESQTKDMPARQALRSFIPSCGVGTGYSRRVIDAMAEAESNRIFDPECLTEDYENGLRLSLRGCRQFFVPLRRVEGSWRATREYFPLDLRAAIRQRTRWITGIALQTWERHGWDARFRDNYWLWRDRKCLLGNPASLLANLLSGYGALTWMLSEAGGRPWGLGSLLDSRFMGVLLIGTLVLQSVHLSFRIFCSARLYGFFFALGVPIRAVWGNWINSRAAIAAMIGYANAIRRKEPLVWVKTDHFYPSRAALMGSRRFLGDILSGSGYITPDQLAHALETKGKRRLGEFLVAEGLIDTEDLCEALALQNNLPYGRIEPVSVAKNVVRSLPAEVILECNVLPFRIFSGDLFLASPEPPSEKMERRLRKFTRLAIRFHLVTEENFIELRDTLLFP